MARVEWVSVGGGAYQSKDARFYITTERYYLGRVGGKAKTERWAVLLDRQTGRRSEHSGIRAAKSAASCAAVLVQREEQVATIAEIQWDSSETSDGFSTTWPEATQPIPPDGDGWRLVAAVPYRDHVQFFWARTLWETTP